jgi:hypothetical protein
MTAIFKDANGVDMLMVVVDQSRPFARACLAEWQARDGKDRFWLLKHKAIYVPLDVVEPARARLSAGSAGDE